MTTTPNRTNTTHTARSVQRAGWPQPFGGRIVGAIIALLMAVTGSLAVAGSADAAIVPTLGLYCGGGQVSANVLVYANQRITGNGQYVSVRYYASDPYGRSQYTNWSKATFAPVGGSGGGITFNGNFTTPGWGMTHVQAQVGYWNGRQWTYDRSWTSLDRCYPNKGIY